MVNMDMSYLIVGIMVASISIGMSLLTWTFPETKSLAAGGGFGGDDDDEMKGIVHARSDMDRSNVSVTSTGSGASRGNKFSRSRTR